MSRRASSGGGDKLDKYDDDAHVSLFRELRILPLMPLMGLSRPLNLGYRIVCGDDLGIRLTAERLVSLSYKVLDKMILKL